MGEIIKVFKNKQAKYLELVEWNLLPIFIHESTKKLKSNPVNHGRIPIG